jgi:uncharacterized protein YutE (UPF0331/DUF86 family)
VTVDPLVIRLRLDRIARAMEILKVAASTDREGFLSDQVLQDATERNLQLAAQAVIDISTHLVAHSHWGTPESYIDAVKFIGQKRIISSALAGRLIELVKLRNVLVHMYLEVDLTIVHENAHSAIKDLKEFITSVSRSLT